MHIQDAIPVGETWIYKIYSRWSDINQYLFKALCTEKLRMGPGIRFNIKARIIIIQEL